MRRDHDRMDVSGRCETATEKAIRRLGHQVETYGQALLNDTTRKLLRGNGIPALDRWLADFLVKLSSGPVVLVDAKFSYPRHVNHSIEMRSLLCARREQLPTHYVCSTANSDGRKFTDFKVIQSTRVPTIKACCPSCLLTFQSSPDVMIVNQLLPERCPSWTSDKGGSGTPYFVVDKAAFPVYGDPFGFAPPPPQPCRVCGGAVLFVGQPDPTIHPACKAWPTTGKKYGPDWREGVV